MTEERASEIGYMECETPSGASNSEASLSWTPPLLSEDKRKAYKFDGTGKYFPMKWDLREGKTNEFHWYHVELSRPCFGNQKLAVSAKQLINVLCPPLKLQDILSLVSNGPFCAHVDGALVFRVNSSGPTSSKFTIRLAARVTERSLITVSLGRIPRMGFSPSAQSILSMIPSVEGPSVVGDDKKVGPNLIKIKDHVLEFMATRNHSEEVDNPVPRTMSNLLVHIIDTYMDHLQDIVTEIEMELDIVEFDLDEAIGGFAMKKQMLDSRRFPKMHLNLQRLLQVVAYAEQVFPRVKEKCATKNWFASEDIVSLEELIGRLRRLKENLGFIDNRVTAIQVELGSWHSEQINQKLSHFSTFSMICLPLSIITGIFGMNVGGVPWTGQRDPDLNGFNNVLWVCVIIIIITSFSLLLYTKFPLVCTHICAWRRHGTFRSDSGNLKSFLKRNFQVQEPWSDEYNYDRL